MTNGESRELLSVGIDVGTTTTQVVFSRLRVRNVARLGLVPRIEVDERSVVHIGEAVLTPLLGADEIDAERLLEIVRGEYAAAGVTHDEVETGAVIITGETARRRNADVVLEALSGLAGDFVVTVAGPNLEAQIAGRGSGAAAHSASHYTTVTNIDIGGGSANAAVFRSGRHLSSAAIMVGGRGVQVEPTSGMITSVTPAADRVASASGLAIDVGRRADVTTLRAFTDALAELVVDLFTSADSALLDEVRLTPPLDPAPPSSAVFLSGGVGRCYYAETPAETIDEIAAFGDIGPLLARSLRANPRLRAVAVQPPAHTLDATVLGAASQTVTLSGTTIWARADLLPLRNLPVIEPVATALTDSPEELTSAIRHAARRWDAEGDGRVAIALDLPSDLDYAALATIADGLAAYTTGVPDDGARGHSVPLVVITEEDYAQVLGQTLQGLRPGLPLIAIDQIGLGEGDFIDIGTPMLDGRAVPVSVKTLVFDG